MESVPYQQEIRKNGSEMFERHSMAEGQEPDIGRGIATAMGATR
jgi:hypothetical protein